MPRGPPTWRSPRYLRDGASEPDLAVAAGMRSIICHCRFHQIIQRLGCSVCRPHFGRFGCKADQPHVGVALAVLKPGGIQGRPDLLQLGTVCFNGEAAVDGGIDFGVTTGDLVARILACGRILADVGVPAGQELQCVVVLARVMRHRARIGRGRRQHPHIDVFDAVPEGNFQVVVAHVDPFSVHAVSVRGTMWRPFRFPRAPSCQS